jgi:hypothetical protein
MINRLPMFTCLHFYGNVSAQRSGYVTDERSMTIRLLTSELIKDGVLQKDVFEQVCRAFDGGVSLALTTEHG